MSYNHVYDELVTKLQKSISESLEGLDTSDSPHSINKTVEATVGNIDAVAEITIYLSYGIGGEINGWKEEIFDIEEVTIDELNVFMEGEYMSAITSIVKNKLKI